MSDIRYDLKRWEERARELGFYAGLRSHLAHLDVHCGRGEGMTKFLTTEVARSALSENRDFKVVYVIHNWRAFDYAVKLMWCDELQVVRHRHLVRNTDTGSGMVMIDNEMFARDGIIGSRPDLVIVDAGGRHFTHRFAASLDHVVARGVPMILGSTE